MSKIPSIQEKESSNPLSTSGYKVGRYIHAWILVSGIPHRCVEQLTIQTHKIECIRG